MTSPNTTSIPPLQETSEVPTNSASLNQENALLKNQLMTSSLIDELTRVMYSCTDLDSIIKTVLLGLHEILEFDRVILFDVDRAHFCIKPHVWVGVSDESVAPLNISLGFEGGDIIDAIFLNRHIIVDPPDPQFDKFAQALSTKRYLVIPLLSKATRKCWEVKSCNKTACPAYGSYNPFCWSITGAAQFLGVTSEYDKRLGCLQCPCFKVEGVFWMDRHLKGTPIVSNDVTALTTVINQAGIIIENFRIRSDLEVANDNLQKANEQLHIVNYDLQVAQNKINNDLDHARSIQQGLLPRDIPSIKGLSLDARYIPALAVGGDYYDVFAIAPDLYGIIVADVSGHGISSSLIMSMVKVLIKTSISSEHSPQKTLEHINRIFLTEIKTDNFVTVFYAIVDLATQSIRYTSAGHCPSLFIDKETKNVLQVKADGLFLGVFPDMMLKEASITYKTGRERWVLYTDGLTEAQNDEEDMFDLNYLQEAALQTLDLPPKQACDEILARQRAFCGKNVSPADDITLMVIDF
ncbi:MAG: PP2C family protein-serine/threonine phosphatase [Chitinivibrionales bacterium]|nr:PP2C family protein-serine/threonine phosphatase [Chitinivibrionales bacterium]